MLAPCTVVLFSQFNDFHQSVCLTTFSERCHERVIDNHSVKSTIAELDITYGSSVHVLKLTLYTNCYKTLKFTLIVNFLRTRQHYLLNNEIKF